MICNRREGHEADETTKDKPDGNRCPEDDFLPLLARLWNLGPWLFVLATLESCALELSLSRYMYSYSYVRIGMQSGNNKGLPDTAGKYEYGLRSSCDALRLRRVGVVKGFEAGVWGVLVEAWIEFLLELSCEFLADILKFSNTGALHVTEYDEWQGTRSE